MVGRALEIVGHSLEESVRFDAKVGPGVHVMKEYVTFCELLHSGTKAELRDCLKRQLLAIRMLKDANWRVGNMRYAPLASQYIRAGDTEGAKAVLEEQATIWREKEEDLVGNHKYEFAIHLILRAETEQSRRPDLSTQYLHQAFDLFRDGGYGNIRFSRAIEQLLVKCVAGAGGDAKAVDKHRSNAAALVPQGGEYYFFGALGE